MFTLQNLCFSFICPVWDTVWNSSTFMTCCRWIGYELMTPPANDIHLHLHVVVRCCSLVNKSPVGTGGGRIRRGIGLSLITHPSIAQLSWPNIERVACHAMIDNDVKYWEVHLFWICWFMFVSNMISINGNYCVTRVGTMRTFYQNINGIHISKVLQRIFCRFSVRIG